MHNFTSSLTSRSQCIFIGWPWHLPPLLTAVVGQHFMVYTIYVFYCLLQAQPSTYQTSTPQIKRSLLQPTWSTSKEASTSSFNMQSSNVSNMHGQQFRGEVNQIARTVRMNQGKPTGNGLVRTYYKNMRLQQEANLARIQNHLNQSNMNSKSQQLKSIYQNAQQATARNLALQHMKTKGNALPNQNRQPSLPFRQEVQSRLTQPGSSRTAQLQNRQFPRFQPQIRNTPAKTSIWKPNLNNFGSQPNARQMKTNQQITTEPISSSSTHLTQEKVRNRIAQLQQQNKLSTMKRFSQTNNAQNTPAQSTSNQKLLEDMKKSK